MIMIIKDLYKKMIARRHGRINQQNREKLVNTTPTLICSNCFGGILYHWLGLQFRSPFINLYLDNDDFITLLENFDEFMESPILEDRNSGKSYPIGIGPYDVRIHFMHYPDFNSAIKKWEERKVRIDRSNMGIMLSNFNLTPPQLQQSVIQRFNKLPMQHKVIFSFGDIEADNVFNLKGFRKNQNSRDIPNIWHQRNILGDRFIDQFDYVNFINSLKK